MYIYEKMMYVQLLRQDNYNKSKKHMELTKDTKRDTCYYDNYPFNSSGPPLYNYIYLLYESS